MISLSFGVFFHDSGIQEVTGGDYWRIQELEIDGRERGDPIPLYG